MRARLTTLADQIEHAASELSVLLDRANSLLQSDDMPKPWDRWQQAIYDASSASFDANHSDEITGTITAMRAAAEMLE